jgi:hypothetical protein
VGGHPEDEHPPDDPQEPFGSRQTAASRDALSHPKGAAAHLRSPTNRYQSRPRTPYFVKNNKILYIALIKSSKAILAFDIPKSKHLPHETSEKRCIFYRHSKQLLTFG